MKELKQKKCLYGHTTTREDKKYCDATAPTRDEKCGQEYK